MKLPRKGHNHKTQPSRGTERRTDEGQTVTNRNGTSAIIVIHPKMYSKTCVRQPPLKLTLVVDVEKCLSYKGTCHVILLAKFHDMYLYKTDNFFHISHSLKSVSKVALLHRFYCTATEEPRGEWIH